jgi:hypothetical protein
MLCQSQIVLRVQEAQGYAFFVSSGSQVHARMWGLGGPTGPQPPLWLFVGVVSAWADKHLKWHGSRIAVVLGSQLGCLLCRFEVLGLLWSLIA